MISLNLWKVIRHPDTGPTINKSLKQKRRWIGSAPIFIELVGLCRFDHQLHPQAKLGVARLRES